MPGFHLYRSSSTQALADRFVQVVTEPGAALSVEADELVVVQGRGMERWLGQRAAARLGVWAGARFPYPRAAAAELAGVVLGEAVPRTGDSELLLAFAIAGELPGLIATPDGERVRASLGGDEARLFPFAQQVARVFDGYLVFRQDMLDRWGRGQTAGSGGPAAIDELWQAALWRALVHRAEREAARGAPQLAAVVGFWGKVVRATAALEQGAPCTGVTRVSVFAVANMPPHLVRFFVALGAVCDVHWYAVDPAAETAGTPAAITEALCAADLESVMIVRDAAAHAAAAGTSVDEQVLPGAPVAATAPMLARVQWQARTGEVLHGSHATDRSLRVHACPGVVREAEVLHDEILRAFDELPGLVHEDIVVLVPDIAAYAPAIEAVVRGGRGIGEHGTEARVPTTVADLSDRDGSPVAVALATALHIADGDMGMRAALELLGQRVVADRFVPAGLAPEILVRWLDEAGGRRFLDEEHRAGAGLPPTGEGTWAAAFDRLYAGLAAEGEHAGAVPGTQVLPARPVRSNTEAIGRVTEFAALLRGLRAMATPADGGRTPAEWVARTRGMLAQLAPAHGDGEREARGIGQVLAGIEQAAAAAGFDGLLPYSAARALVVQALATGRAGRGFLAGGVTVCQFVPMRAVPFRVVCMVGMEDTQFPRGSVRCAFDALSVERRAGDPDTRADDRALFLQSVLGASDRLVVTFPAQDLATGAPRAMSTPVAALLDAAAQLAAPADASLAAREAARSALVVHHPLHAFSAGAFDARAVREDRVGYDARARVAAVRLHRAGGLHGPSVFLPERPETRMVDAAQVVSLAELCEFYRNPARATLRAWGITLRGAEESPPACEATHVSAFDHSVLARELVASALEHGGVVPAGARARMQGGGRLPLGPVGLLHAGAIAQDVEHLLAEALPHGAHWAEVDTTMTGTRVRGQVLRSGEGIVLCVGGGIGATQRLEGWLHHIAYAAAHGGAPAGSVFGRGKPASVTLRAVTQAEALTHLRELIAVRAFGLAHGVPLFPELSAAAAEHLLAGKPAQYAAHRARMSAEGHSDAHRDPLGEHARVLFRGHDPFELDMGDVPGACRAVFTQVAQCVFGPCAGREGPA